MRKFYPIKSICFIFSGLLIFSSHAFSQKIVTVYDQLVYVNDQWKNQQDIPAELKSKEALKLNEKGLIQLHLSETEKLLRARSTARLSGAQQKSRESNLDVLHSYWINGIFPVNDQHLNRQPYFIDKYNTYCAVGHLMKESGADDIAREILNTQNFSYLADISHPRLMSWVAASGLTLDELALIQPGYGGEWPACLTEMHYNNTGQDVNEYIEIHQSNGQLSGMQSFSIVEFYDHTGVKYKTLPISAMQMFTGNASQFYYYQFPAGESFADSGTIRILAGIQETNQNKLAIYKYNSTGVNHIDSSAWNYQGQPITRHYSSSENESTVINTSLTFIGFYNSSWSMASLPATRGFLNPLTLDPVSVSFSSFSYTLSGKTVELNWQTSAEFETNNFIIERSSNGITYEAIGKIKAAGYSNNPKNYRFKDVKPNYINHYRIRQENFDGKLSYSKILYVKVEKAMPISITENMIKDVIHLSVDPAFQKGNAITIFDMQGKVMMNWPDKVGNQVLNVSTLSAGKYILSAQVNTGETYKVQFLKIR